MSDESYPTLGETDGQAGELAQGADYAAGEKKSYPLGILLVHGVGQQQRGETVPNGGEPLQKWLNAWLWGRARKQIPSTLGRSVFIDDTRLVDRIPSEGDAPAYSILHFQKDEKTVMPDDVEWVVAESWWAHELMPPKFDELLRWGLGMGPWMLNRSGPPGLNRILDAIEHRWKVVREVVEANSSGLWQLAFKPIGWLLTGIQTISLGLVRVLSKVLFYIAGFLAQILMLALQVLSIVPGLGGVVTSIQSSLSGGLAGDAFLIASSPMRLSSAVSQVERDVKWLLETKGCKTVAIIAHSGGAPIVYKALTQPGSNNRGVALFVSYGSGLSKLAALEKVLGKSQDVTGLFFALSPLLLVGSIASLVTSLYFFAAQNADISWWGPGFFFGGVALFMIFLLMGRAARKASCTGVPVQIRITGKKARAMRAQANSAKPPLQAPGDRGWEELHFEEPIGVVWKDYFALADIVPDGKTRIDLRNSGDKGVSESVEVSNLHSIIKDHDSYWKNDEEFTAEVVRGLGRAGGVNDLITNEEEEVLKRALALRRNRVYTYLTAGLLSTLSVPLLWFGLGGWLVEMGQWVRGIVGSIFSIFDFNNSASEAATSADGLWNVLWGTVTVALLAVLWFRIALFPAWRLWSREEREDMFNRTYEKPKHGSATWFYIFACLLPLGTTALLIYRSIESSKLTMDISAVVESLINFFANAGSEAEPTEIGFVIQWILIIMSCIIALSIIVGVIASWRLRATIYGKKVGEKSGKPKYQEILDAEGNNPVFGEAQDVVYGVAGSTTP
jgi:hypothetical protein